MPLSQPARYRVTTTRKGNKIRLAFTKGGQVIEAKNLASGATHSEADFKKDRAQRKGMKHALTGK